jgi:hypothetical protein
MRVRSFAACLALTGLIIAGLSLADGPYLGAGQGLATFQHPGQARQLCPAIHAVLEWHPPVSGEPMLNVAFAAGQGAPPELCLPGWHDDFGPQEVHGTPAKGLQAHRTSPDADIWLNMSAPVNGVSHLTLHQLAFLGGDLYDFAGDITEVA